MGSIPPNHVECTVEKVAINATMAGCKPEYLPVVLASVEAALDPAFCLHGLIATTWLSGPMIVVNGDIRQDLNTSDMGRPVEEVLEFASWITTLQPGDVVSTGTNHIGLSPIQDGDSIDMEIQGLGRLTVSVQDDWKRTWPREPLSRMTAFESTARSKIQPR